MGPLSGVRVVEFAGIGPAPFCAMMLSDLGADVVRIDRPAPPTAATDPGMGSIVDGILGRGRRSIALNLKRPEAVGTALDLVAAADALIEGFRPGVMERLGVGPDVCLQRNPKLVYGRLTGWGQDGPYALVAGHDLNYIALAGALAPVGRREGPPVAALNLVGDFAGGGMLMATGILAALLEAGRSGRGQVVDAAMVDGSAYLMTMMYELLGRGAWTERRQSNPNDGAAHFYDTYETSDGEYVAIAAMEPQFYAELIEKIGLADANLPPQWDRTRWPELRERLAAVFRTRSRAGWCALLEGSNACFAPVLRMSEALTHPHNVARSTFTTVDGVAVPSPAPRFDRTPAGVARGASRPGEHTDEVLAELGTSAERIAELRESGAVS
jgi:alpha-methylacyl-CoA racemase